MYRDALCTLVGLIRRVVISAAFVGAVYATMTCLRFGFGGGLVKELGRSQCGHGSGLRRAKVVVERARDELEQFALEQHRCPTSEGELVETGYSSLPAKDPWGTSLLFHCAVERSGYTIWATSAGPDRTFGTSDDIMKADSS
jgi:hypothetical protein